MKSKINFTGIKILTFILISCSSIFGQNITNTMGTNGSFKIKDGVNTYFTLTQSNGYIDLTKSLKLVSTTSSSTGIIFKNNSRFIHDYSDAGTSGGNLFIGINSGNFTLGGSAQDGSFNIGLGSNSLTSLTTGYSNTGLGSSSLNANTTGTQNTAVGQGSLNDNTTGSSNCAFGVYSLANNSIGTLNSAFGTQSLNSNTTGLHNTSVGAYSLVLNTTGSYNTAVGYYALYNSTSGSNTAVGYYALTSTTTGFRVTAVGYKSLEDNTTGDDNTSLGYNTLLNSTIGNENTAIGSLTGENVTTGSNLTLIGFNAEPTSGSASNQITLGNSSVTSLRCNVQSISSLSDRRDKTNINDLTLGLDFITKLKPRQFNWDRREWYDNGISDGSKMQEAPTAGFIAQELNDVQTSENAEWLNLVLKDNPDKWEATYGNLLPVMVKAIQELKEENDKIKQENEKLKKEISELKSLEERITMIELTIMKDSYLKEIKTAEK